MSAPVAVAEIVRSGFVEGRHYGSVVALEADGSVAWSVGDVDSPMFPRSCNKLMQAVGMLRAGLDLDGKLLALACASHSGEPFHIEGVRQILEGAGLDEKHLQTPPDYPTDEQAREEVLRAGGEKTSIAMNCSGKHAAMLATCVANGWDTDTYRDPQHPLQVAIKDAVESLTGEPATMVAVDGCGAPLLSTSLTGLARAFRAISLASSGPEQRVASAIREFPEYTSGSRRDEAKLLRAIPGAIGKAGAEGCYAVGLPDGRAVALKIEDGATRVRPVLMVAALERLGLGLDKLDHPEGELDQPGLVDVEAVRRTGAVEVYGGGKPVGVLRAVF